MKFGVQVNCYGTTWDDIRASIETMEAGAGIASGSPTTSFPPGTGPKDTQVRNIERRSKVIP